MRKYGFIAAPQTAAEAARKSYRALQKADERANSAKTREKHLEFERRRRPEGRDCLPDEDGRQIVFKKLLAERPMRSKKMREWFRLLIVKRKTFEEASAAAHCTLRSEERYKNLFKTFRELSFERG